MGSLKNARERPGAHRGDGWRGGETEGALMTRVRNSILIAGFAVALAVTMPVAAQAPGVAAPPAAAQSPGDIASDYYARGVHPG